MTEQPGGQWQPPGSASAGALPPDIAAYAEEQGLNLAALFSPRQEEEAAPERRVYMGQRKRKSSRRTGVQGGMVQESTARDRLERGVDRFMNFDEAVLHFNTWNDEQVKRFAERLVNEGIIPADYTFGDVRTAWQTFVEEAERFTAVGRKVSPWDMVAYFSGERIGGGGADGSGKRKQHTETRFRLSTADEARGMLSQMLAQVIGRAPTGQEIDDFHASLNAEERANPSVTTTVYDEEGQGTSVTEGGMDPSAFAATHAQGEDFESEAGAYQAASTYMTALREAIGPVV